MMNKYPLFSVLIANYNDGRFLLDAVNSVFSQTYTNWEIVLVDDYSSDDSLEIYKSLKSDDRIRIYRNTENKGCGYTKRRLVELSRGEICGFLDADDKLTTNALEVMVDTHCRHPEASLVYSRFYWTDEDFNNQSISEQQRQLPDGVSLLDQVGSVSHFATFKRVYYDKTDGIIPFVSIAEDHDLYLKLDEVGELVFIDAPLYYYRTNTGNNISLGEVNADRAILNDIAVIASACFRRGIPAEEKTMRIFSNCINKYKVESNYYRKEYDRISSSKAYRIGKAILRPFRMMKRLFMC